MSEAFASGTKFKGIQKKSNQDEYFNGIKVQFNITYVKRIKIIAKIP